MKVIWSDESWKDFEYWLDNNQKIVKRIRKLIQNTRRTPFEGIGKPEPLKGDMAGLWSRRITNEHRFVYFVNEDGLNIVSVRFHYSD
ncbi:MULTISPECIES: Txe/YoeB family addiction module toxin [Lactobacillus]|jgi:toxin YoeB|uniref:Endoribonuclease YoeB n=1 Tax=Lactobacillus gallinarum TaxID=52242 RepID=A0A1Y4W2S4_9LACO|nr:MULTISPECIES: Txe/YoeB family addiction module toxin [Lactobacillus]NMB31352.1 Txe/YoeB family addiction module toxin [Lactobacillus sp.]MBM6958947.1 Txe/YoeB family addiction module toxin [Lactobacillus gallinarum]MBM6972809.1 Txe/YoeB family addiction module toxin [Lactobacillus gallinarum]MCC9271296.1 Txe/YoeB family addiction module toxin [Lactobacillus gallinarum]MDM8281184.1 Txe/YoeB family addiction module toxin [Lactobacillus gallinarum]